MRIKKHRDSRRASKKLKELLRDRPFGLSNTWDDPRVSFSEWGGSAPAEDERYDDDDEFELMAIQDRR